MHKTYKKIKRERKREQGVLEVREHKIGNDEPPQSVDPESDYVWTEKVAVPA